MIKTGIGIRGFVLTLLFMGIFVFSSNVASASEWVKTYGGGGDDIPNSFQQTTDGGYIVAGYTYSFGAGGQDIWVLKLDVDGNVQWQKTYVGTDYDLANSIQQTSDGGYIVAG